MASTRNTTSEQEDSPAGPLSRASSASTNGPDVIHSLKRREPPSDNADNPHKRAKSSSDAAKQSFQQIAQSIEHSAQLPRTLTSSDGQIAAIAHHATNAMGLQSSAASGMNNPPLMPFVNGMAMGGPYGNYPYSSGWTSGPPSYYSYPAAPMYHSSYPQVNAQYPPQNLSSRSQSSVQSDQDKESNDQRFSELQGLGNLSDKMLCMIGGQDYEELDKDCARGHEYGRLKEIFEGKMEEHNIHGKPFIDPQTLGHLNSTQLSIVRKANLAACMSSIFGSRHISLETIQEHFHDIVVLPDHPLQPWQCDLLLAIKTQACIEALTKNQGEAYSEAKENVVRKFFPEQIELKILAKRNAPKNLLPNEQDFVKKCEQRRQEFLERAIDFPGALSLQAKYSFTELLDKIHACIPKSVEVLSNKVKSTHTHQHDTSKAIFSDGIASFPQPVQRYQGFPPVSYDDHLRRNMAMANAAINGPQNTGSEMSASLPIYQAYPQVNAQQRSPFAPAHASAISSPSPTRQSLPTQDLFDKARDTTTVRAPPSSRKPGVANQRRAWSLEEERALLDGLDQVKGPHWSQILALYGVNGTISEVLKERNQVQLKDKARNLKLFFLKSNVEVPFFLQGVTGDLRTRAPAQAAKLENAKLEEEKRRADAQAVQSLTDDRMMEAAATLVGGARWPSGEEPYGQMTFSGNGRASLGPVLGHGSGEGTHSNEQLAKVMLNSAGH
ncbi:hypothetical protein K490DRAFT_64260 [Saccharata proteae CBS 121410]|uniref:HTH myb-type domain-containing protein n=1 Tax=Saccharata proteae CBS 121410 TaxID=1314787 RepID=A0A6A5YE03_9PEZI|nr:hypothetical protein K490DRAFT_64260 [Saccharata proteae CBS 121410]